MSLALALGIQALALAWPDLEHNWVALALALGVQALSLALAFPWTELSGFDLGLGDPGLVTCGLVNITDS